MKLTTIFLGCQLALGLVAAELKPVIDLPLISSRHTNTVKLAPGPDDAGIARLAARIMERSHYSQQPLDEATSAKFFDHYFDALDPAHMLFLQSDVAEFTPWRNKLGDMTVKLGDTSPADIIFNRFMERYEQHLQFITSQVATATFEFKGDDRYTLNRKELPRPKDLDEAKKMWLERLRYEFLQEKLNKEKPPEIVKIITRRYLRQLRMLRDFDSDEVFQIYMNALTHLYDPHSDYMGKPAADNFAISMKLSLFGIGAQLQSQDGYCKIMDLIAGGPAMLSKKLKPNDRIIAVAQGTNEPVDCVDMKLNKVVEMIRGPKDTEVRLTIIPVDAPDPSTRKVVTLIRDKINLEDGEAKSKIIELPAVNGKTQRLGIIDLPSFYGDMQSRRPDRKSPTTDVAKLLKKFMDEKVGGVILDLRRNGGGSLEESINLTGLFIKEGPVVQVRDSDGKITVDKDTDPSVLYDGPLIVLTSRFSASASEILAGALQDYGRALIVGDISTHGKGTVQSLLDLGPIVRTTNNLGSLKITIRKFYRPGGSSTQLKGVTPDIILPSINNHADLGEGSLPSAMPWDTIPSAKFEPVNYIAPHLEELRKRVAARINTDKDYNYVRAEIERYKKIKEEKSVSMNEEQRRAEMKENEARAEARKKELRARAEPDYKTYDITLKIADQPGLPAPTVKTNAVAAVKTPKEPKPKTDDDEATKDDEAKDEAVPAVDINLEEAKRILIDLISLWPKNGNVAVTK